MINEESGSSIPVGMTDQEIINCVSIEIDQIGGIAGMAGGDILTIKIGCQK